MKKPDTATQLEYRQRQSQLGRPRLCPKCNRQVSTVHRQFVTHGPDPDGSFTCSNSGAAVSTEPVPNARTNSSGTNPVSA